MVLKKRAFAVRSRVVGFLSLLLGTFVVAPQLAGIQATVLGQSTDEGIKAPKSESPNESKSNPTQIKDVSKSPSEKEAGKQSNWKLYLCAGVTLACLALLAATSIPPDMVLLGCVLALLLPGAISVKEALAGFSNEGVATITVLFVVGAGVRETGAIDILTKRFLGTTSSVISAITRVVVPTTIISAFMNNTPLVAIMIPAIREYSRTSRIPSSKLMIPLSFAAILGGTCTLIGTSTNLVVRGKLVEELQYKMGMFDISWVGVPAAIVGCLYLCYLGPYLLPDRNAVLSTNDDPREYTIEMQVSADGPLVGQSIEKAGLRHLPGLFLAEIERAGNAIPAVSPREILRAGDRLLFVGVVESVVELQRVRGLIPANEEVFHLQTPRPNRCLIEAVVSNSNPHLGETIRESRFRSNYNAVVVAVARNGERLRQRIGDITICSGDTVLVEAHPSFADQHRSSRDFFLVSRVEESSPPRHNMAWFSIAILLVMVFVVAINRATPLIAGSITAAIMLITRCLSVEAARRSLDWSTIIAVAASFALASGLETSGAADLFAIKTREFAAGSPWVALAIVYLVTLITTELITNNAAAALMFPIALATARSLGVSYMPFMIAIMMAASAGFATPIGYQTNLMVYGPGGYRFMDYVKIGLPLDILIWIVTVAITPFVFPFHRV